MQNSPLDLRLNHDYKGQYRSRLSKRKEGVKIEPVVQPIKKPRMLGRPKGQCQGETRQRILNESLRQFSICGYDGTSVRQIAHAVGVTEAAIYSHFSSKDAIMDLLWKDYGIDGSIEILKACGVESQIEAWEQLLTGFVGRIIEEWSAPRARMFARLMLNQTANQGCHSMPKMKDAIQCFDATLKDIFSLLMNKGLIKRAEPDVLVLEFFAPILMIKHKFLTFDEAEGDQERASVKAAALALQHVAFFLSCIKA